MDFLIYSVLYCIETLRYLRSVSAVFTPETVQCFKSNT